MGGVVECIRKDFSIKNPKTEEDYDERDQRIRMKDLDDDVYGRQSDSNSVYIPRARVDQQRFPDKKIGHYQDNFLEKKGLSQTFSYKPSKATTMKFGFDNIKFLKYNIFASKLNSCGQSTERSCPRKVRAPQSKNNG